MPDQPTEKRRVESHDPTLSDHANRLLTDELRQVVGAESVTVPLARHDAAGDRHATHSPGVADLINVRMGLVVTAFVLLISGGVVVVAAGGTVALVVVTAALVACVAVIVWVVGRMTDEREHPSPQLSAALEEEGVGDPDRLLTDLADEYRGSPASKRDGGYRGGEGRRTGATVEDRIHARPDRHRVARR